MNEQKLENVASVTRGAEENIVEGSPMNNYEQYRNLGGIINEKDYQSAFDRIEGITSLEKKSIDQAKLIARVAGIKLDSSDSTLDPRVALYLILRIDIDLKAMYHHSQMSDQQLFAEVLRMLGDEDSLQKLINAHPNIFPKNN